MKIALLVVAILLHFFAPDLHAAYYQWTDSQGVVHFTDNSDKIPKRYQKKAKRLDLPETRAPEPVAAPEPPAARAAPTARQPEKYGGHTEQWWRERFVELRSELQALQDGLPEKQKKLVQLRRKRVIYTRARDRVALNRMKDEIAVDEKRIAELQNRIILLEQEAARAFVPAEWRQ